MAIKKQGSLWSFPPAPIHRQQPPFFQGLGPHSIPLTAASTFLLSPSQSTQYLLSNACLLGKEEACTVGITTQRRHHQGFRRRRTGREVSEASSICQTIYRTIGRAELTQTDFSCKKELPHQEPLTPMPDNISSNSRTVTPSTKTITTSKSSE